ncbi:MAG: co-chaperone protein HscB [Pseudomonadota bacterium]|jgi:molecular chaperone HscB
MKLADDDFTLLGLPPRQQLDRALLDTRRRELQAQVHPDRFASEGAAAQRLAMQWAVRVNEAWQRLKDPLSRAAYLCELRGVPIAAEDNTAMPREFLLQQMAWREALDDATDAAAVQALDDTVAREERLLHQRLQTLLDEQSDTAAAAGQVRALMFVTRFREALAQRLDRLHA